MTNAFRVTVGNPPEDVRTLGQWLAWRERETQRMMLELFAGLAYHHALDRIERGDDDPLQ